MDVDEEPLSMIPDEEETPPPSMSNIKKDITYTVPENIIGSNSSSSTPERISPSGSLHLHGLNTSFIFYEVLSMLSILTSFEYDFTLQLPV